MLKKFIEMQCKNFGIDRDKVYKNKKIETLETQFLELAKEIKKIDSDLGDKTDVLVGTMVAIYGDVFFKEGFKEGLILAQEIQQLLLEKH